ncbi:MAG: asparagine synthase-related protein [Solirubrobacteraceae bacterium]
MPATPYLLRGAELASSLVVGSDPARAPLQPRRGQPAELRSVLEGVVRTALERPPCLIAFSGGRDSSGLLALAVDVARREGLPLPIPATNQFPGIHDVDESHWQELLVAHLGLTEWLRLEITDELDLIGPLAGPLLRRFGVIWPPNSHLLQRAAPSARGGTIVTGVGGDELFEPSAHRGARVLAREVRPARGDLRAVAVALMPRRIRRTRARRGLSAPIWLRPHVAALWRDEVAQLAVEPTLRWGETVVDHWWRSRARLGLVQSIQAVTGDEIVVEHPFMHPDFLRSVAGACWRTGFASRRDAMQLLFGGLVPEALLARRDKAVFFEPFVNRYSRDFIQSWDGSGVDSDLVDPEVLGRTWAQPQVDARSYPLLQAAWLSTNPGHLT